MKKQQLICFDDIVGEYDVEKQELDLSCRRLRDADMPKLIEFLKQHAEIRSLNLNNNWITSRGARVLAFLNTIISLDLGGNYVGDEGAKALALNNTITSLDLRSNDSEPYRKSTSTKQG